MLNNDYIYGVKVQREHAAEVRDMIKKNRNITYKRMNVMCDKAYKVLWLHGSVDEVLDTVKDIDYVVDVVC